MPILPPISGFCSCAMRWLSVLCLGSACVWADTAKDPYLEMSLEDLLDIQVTSVARKEQRLADAAAAVFVVTRNDIRRSGATNLPDILRMVPGLNVARIDANKWAVSARGQNGLWANKLLVLLDGRSLYTPLFAGVWWDIQNPMLEDIERIEVIRGPGATLWGANAVNGVINIITRGARDTQGGLVSAGYGSEEPGFAAVRYGGAFSEDGHYRVYAKGLQRDDSRLAAGGTARDGGDLSSAGFRIDWAPGGDAFTVQGDLYSGNNRQTTLVDSLTPPHQTTLDDQDELSGGNLLGRWTRTLSESSDLSLQASLEHNDRASRLIKEARDTLDLDFQHRLALGMHQEIVWGLGLRWTEDEIRGSRATNVAIPKRTEALYSGFLQDEVQLLPDRLYLTVGTKLEQNGYSGTEIQPSVRLRWTLDARQSLWAAVSRAVRTPSRWDSDGRINNTFAGYPVPTVISFSGNPDMESERLLAYEAGYRIQSGSDLSLEAAVFYNDYRGLRGVSPAPPRCLPSETLPPCFIPGDNQLSVLFEFDNSLAGNSYGLELNADWRPWDGLRLVAAYSYLQAQFDSATGTRLDEQIADSAPRHQASLRTQLDPTGDTELDLWLRYADAIPTLGVDPYLTLDLRLAWRPVRDLELSLIGRNLLQPSQTQFVEFQQNLRPTEVERSVHAQLRWRF